MATVWPVPALADGALYADWRYAGSVRTVVAEHAVRAGGADPGRRRARRERGDVLPEEVGAHVRVAVGEARAHRVGADVHVDLAAAAEVDDVAGPGQARGLPRGGSARRGGTGRGEPDDDEARRRDGERRPNDPPRHSHPASLLRRTSPSTPGLISSTSCCHNFSAESFGRYRASIVRFPNRSISLRDAQQLHAGPDPELAPAVRGLALAARSLEQAAGDLTLAQYRVLAFVAAGNERSSLVAEGLALAKPTVTAAVDGLVERELLTREAVEGDRRSLRLAVTARGRGGAAARPSTRWASGSTGCSSTPATPTRCSPRSCDLDDAVADAHAGCGSARRCARDHDRARAAQHEPVGARCRRRPPAP